MNDANARVFVKQQQQQQSRSRLAFCVSKISRARGATLTYCFFFSFSLRVGIVGVLLFIAIILWNDGHSWRRCTINTASDGRLSRDLSTAGPISSAWVDGGDT